MRKFEYNPQRSVMLSGNNIPFGMLRCSFIAMVLCIAFLSSCVSVKTGPGGNRTPSLVKMFNKGKDSLLCHAGPVEFSPVMGGDELELDYTYLKVKGHSNNVVCNFSLISKDASLRPEKVTVDLNSKQTTVTQLEKFFAEGVGKKHYKYRYSFQIPDSVFYDWMQTERPRITVNDRVFEGRKDFRKKSSVIFRSILFDMYD